MWVCGIGGSWVCGYVGMCVSVYVYTYQHVDVSTLRHSDTPTLRHSDTYTYRRVDLIYRYTPVYQGTRGTPRLSEGGRALVPLPNTRIAFPTHFLTISRTILQHKKKSARKRSISTEEPKPILVNYPCAVQANLGQARFCAAHQPPSRSHQPRFPPFSRPYWRISRPSLPAASPPPARYPPHPRR
jgi:hypothetical protein